MLAFDEDITVTLPLQKGTLEGKRYAVTKKYEESNWKIIQAANIEMNDNGKSVKYKVSTCVYNSHVLRPAAPKSYSFFEQVHSKTNSHFSFEFWGFPVFKPGR